MSTCSRSIRLSLRPMGSAILKAERPVRNHAALSVQFWVRAQAGNRKTDQGDRCERKPRSFRFGCSATVCISLRQSTASGAAEKNALLVPVCAFGSLRLHTWRKIVVPASPFAPYFGAYFDEIVLLASSTSVDLLLDDVVIMSAARPPPTLSFPTPPKVSRSKSGAKKGAVGLSKAAAAGRCRYLASANRARACRVWDGDHLEGKWVQTCTPDAIKRPDRYAYARSLDHSAGQWDYRLCFKFGYSERERSRAALTWAWQPRECELHAVDGALLSRWLGNRTMLFWGDSLTAQHFFSFVLMLGDAIDSIRDVDPKDPAGVAELIRGDATPAARRGSACSYGGLGAEGGPLTEARLTAGGRVLKVLGHVELVAQLRGISGVWWRELMASANFVVFNLVGHHLRTIDGSFASHAALVAEALRQLERDTKPDAQLIMRTSNVGHVKCESEAQPLRSRGEAWRRLGGWKWQPPEFTPAYYGGE